MQRLQTEPVMRTAVGPGRKVRLAEEELSPIVRLEQDLDENDG
jgi:hypothetical protein